MNRFNPLRWPLHGQIALALGLAALLGLLIQLTGSRESSFAVGLSTGAEFVGSKLFLSALKMLVVPLVVTSIICGVMQVGAESGVGRLGLKTLLYYTASGAVAVTIGLIVVNLIGPGRVDADVAESMLEFEQSRALSDARFAERFEGAKERDAGDLVAIFERLIPSNVFKASTDNGALLGLIFFSLLFGFFASRLPEAQRRFQSNLWESLSAVILKMTSLVLRFAPFGVFGLVLPIVIRTDFGSLFQTLALFFVTVVVALAIHFGVALFGVLKLIGRIPAVRHYREMAPVLLTAFSTASSSGTLPLTMDTVQRRAGVSSKVSSFTLPLGATVNMDGTALYECVVVVFIAQLFGSVTGDFMSIGDQLLVVVLALTTSIGVAGIPAASLVAILLILGVVGLPPEAIGVVWITDRILDMMRTAVNVFSDTVGAVVIARSEGEAIYAADTENHIGSTR